VITESSKSIFLASRLSKFFFGIACLDFVITSSYSDFIVNIHLVLSVHSKLSDRASQLFMNTGESILCFTSLVNLDLFTPTQNIRAGR
jgi:hypothetical protein